MSHAVNAALFTVAILMVVQVAALVVKALRPTPQLRPIPVEAKRDSRRLPRR